jgi:hypothetical protein
MKGRLIPAGGGPGPLPLTLEAVKMAAAKMAQQKAVEAELSSAMAKMAQVNSIEWPQFLNGMSEMEKDAFIGKLLQLGRGAASRMASSGNRYISRAGQHLQRGIRNPVQVTRYGPAGFAAEARSPLAAVAPPIPHPRPSVAPGAPGWAPGRHVTDPYRRAATGAPVPKGDLGPTLPPGTMPPVDKPARKGMFERLGEKVKGRMDLSRQRQAAAAAEAKAAKTTKEVKSRSLLGSLVPGAILAGGAYGLYKGVPAAVNMATEASRYPMAMGQGFRQYQYGYTPDGQAQF